MTIAESAVRLGPLNVPVWLMLVAGGCAVTVLVQRLLLREQKETWRIANDILLNGAVIGFAVWKLTPLVTRFQAIAQDPVRLLFYPGGTPGIVGGVLFAVAYGMYRILRSEKRAGLMAQLALPAGVIGAAMAVGFLVPAAQSAGVDYDSVPCLTREDDGEWAVGQPCSSSPASLPRVVVYWATWCRPCSAQVPEIVRAYHDLEGKGLILAVNLTHTESGVRGVGAYMDSSGLDFPVALDLDGSLTRAARVGSTPTILIYDATGRERFRRAGVVNSDWIVRRVLPLSP